MCLICYVRSNGFRLFVGANFEMHFSVRLNGALFYFIGKEDDKMTVCALFGDYDTPDNNLEHIYDILLWLVIVCDVDFFYVGTEGNFDETAEIALFNLCSEKPHVGYNQVFADEKYECLYPTRLSKKPLYPSADEEDTAEEASIKRMTKTFLFLTNGRNCLCVHKMHFLSFFCGIFL